MWKKYTFVLMVFVLGFALFAQEIQETAISINIEIPVRIYKGNNFVNDLTIADFEVYEDGVLQEIEAMYLIHKRDIQNREEKQTFTPETSRSFFLIFEVVEYSPKLEEALDYFFNNILEPSDNLTIVTPIKEYQLKNGILNTISIEKLTDEIKGLLRKDAWIGNSEYRQLNKELEEIIRSMSGTSGTSSRPITFRSGGGGGGGTIAVSPDTQVSPSDPIVNMTQYEEIMSRLEDIRDIDQTRLLNFADFLKDQEGQKYVFLFYQREFIPQMTTKAYIDKLSKNDPVTNMKLISSMGYYFRDIIIDTEKIRQAFADSSVSINFLFFTKPAEYIPGVSMVEHSEDIFNVFDEIAQATGGITTSSANPEYLFRRASDAVDSYYLLYYSPKNYKADGKFKAIDVKVKGGNYRITHRAGYIAD